MPTMKATAVKVDAATREFFKKINFHEIPEGATYIAFYEDGDAGFLTDIEFTGLALPRMTFVQYYEDVTVEL